MHRFRRTYRTITTSHDEPRAASSDRWVPDFDPCDRSHAVDERGFFHGYLGLSSIDGSNIAHGVEAQHAGEKERYAIDVEHCRNSLEDKEAQRARAEKRMAAVTRAEEAPAQETAEKWESGLISGFYAPLFLLAAGFFMLGEVALSFVTVGPVLGLATRGPDAWHGWVFAFGLALLSIPLKVAFDHLVAGPLRQHRDARAVKRFEYVMAVLSALSLVTVAAAANLRRVYLLTEEQRQLLPPETLFKSLFDLYPFSTTLAIVLVALVFAVSGAICLSFGFHHVQHVWQRLTASIGKRRRRHTLRRETQRAGKVLEHARSEYRAARDALIRAEGALKGLEARIAHRIRFLTQAYRDSHAEGVKARERAEAGYDPVAEGRHAMEAFWATRGYVLRREDESGHAQHEVTASRETASAGEAGQMPSHPVVPSSTNGAAKASKAAPASFYEQVRLDLQAFAKTAAYSPN